MARLLDTNINDTGYVLLPKGSSGLRPYSSYPAWRYNTDLNTVEYYIPGDWKCVGYPYRYYYEGINANLYTANWNLSATTYLPQFGGFGPMYAHGYTASSTFTLTLTNIPAHNYIRYIVNWHVCDTADNETNTLILPNYSQIDTTYLTFTKIYNSSTFTIGTNLGTVTQSGTKTYTGKNATYPSGYITFDSGYYGHVNTTFYAKHIFGLDQLEADESEYLSHVQVWIG